jgi:GT2 family glycosyltransferase
MNDDRETPDRQRGCDSLPGASPDLSVVIVSWNVAEHVLNCLESIACNVQGMVLEVLLVDNASSDGTVEAVRRRFPWVHVIPNSENVGFARANNQAIAKAKGSFVLLLNPDTVVTAGAISALCEFLASRPEVGMVGPSLRRKDGELDATCARRSFNLGAALCLDSLRLQAVPRLGPYLYRALVSPYDYSRTQPVEAISGAAMLVRRELLQELGGFGEEFLHCGEDMDLCFRIHAAGRQTWYLAEAMIYHLVGQSRKKARVRSEVYRALSVHRYFLRCCGRWQALLYRAMVQGVEAPTLLLIGVWKRLLGRETRDDFLARIHVARGLWRWKQTVGNDPVETGKTGMTGSPAK